MRNLRCLVGWHKWQAMRGDGDLRYRQCRRCSKYRDYPGAGVTTAGAAFQAYGGPI